MEALRETSRSRYSVSIPASDLAMFRSMSRRMGWEAKKITLPVRTKEVRYRALDLALEDVKAGRVTTYSSAEEMFKKLGI